MPSPLRLGMIAPSSNTVLEPTTAALLAGVPHVSSHVARVRVTSISLAGGAVDILMDELTEELVAEATGGDMQASLPI